jgi:methyl-accepting chemotaxis protein
MPKIFANTTIAGRMGLTAAVALAALAMTSINAARVLDRSMYDDRRSKMHAATEIAHSIVVAYGELASSGKMGDADAKRAAMAVLRRARYEGAEYFWINDQQGRFLMHPVKPELEGKDAAETKDPQGRIITQEFVRAVEAGKGESFVEYAWPKPGVSKPVGKVSYVKLYAPWGWIVGTGTYDDDIKSAVALETRRGLAAFVVAALLLAAAVFLVARSMRRGVRALLGEADQLTEAVARGNLRTRAAADAVMSEFRPVVEGMNRTLDAFARPLAVTVEYVTRISKGDIPQPITERYEGDFNQIKDALNLCIASLDGLVGEMKRMAAEQASGDIDASVDDRRFGGAYQTMAAGVNQGVRMHIQNLLEILDVLGRYSEGDFEPILRQLPGKQAIVNEKLALLRSNLRAVSEETHGLIRAAVAGELSTRANAGRFSGDWKAIVGGLNQTLDAVVGPLQVAARYVEQIGRGEIPPKIVEHYAGDFAKVRDSLNQCIDGVNALVQDANALADAAVAGNLSTRADAARHQNDFRKIVEGVNRTLDAILAPVNDAAKVLQRLAVRDLRARVEGAYQGDHARIKESVNATAEALHDAIGQVASAVEQVSSAATQIASSSQAVATGASEQASALTETGASIDTVAGMTGHTADSAQQASALASQARKAATDGAAAVEQLQAAMLNIRASAEGTSQIIKDVSDIAFQTNLLALNAAVEAARAGEAGRGFAVVAEEVRSLALRAKEAASKTEELIRQSVKHAGEGEIGGKAVSGKLQDIVQSVTKVTSIVAEIASASKEQATGIAQVKHAIGEMDKVTQQNAASAEESSSAASELSGQSEELASMVATFQLRDQTGPAATSRSVLKLQRPRSASQGPGKAPSAGPLGVGRNDAFPMGEEITRDF